jgi:hypothetical protein
MPRVSIERTTGIVCAAVFVLAGRLGRCGFIGTEFMPSTETARHQPETVKEPADGSPRTRFISGKRLPIIQSVLVGIMPALAAARC